MEQKYGYRFINTPMSSELYQQIRLAAAKSECSAAELLRRAITRYLDDKELDKAESKGVRVYAS